MTSINKDKVMQALRAVRDLALDRDVVSLGWVGEIKVDDDALRLTLAFPSPLHPGREALAQACAAAAEQVAGVARATVVTTVEVPRGPPVPLPALGEVRNLVAVASGKGGVGKSTVAVNLAHAFAQAGAQVGLLDVDVYGPSVPGMVGLADRRLTETGAEGRLKPLEAYGMHVMSMGFLTNRETPVIWRGPIASQLVRQFLGGVDWGALDYLFIDLPPGTGDIQLTLSQAVPLTGAVIVTTPQEVAHTIAEKGLRMFQQVKVPILGVVENMAYYACPECGHHDPIFREGGGTAAAGKLGLPLLGRIPLNSAIAASGDAGRPLLLHAPEAGVTRAYHEIAVATALELVRNRLAEADNPVAPTEVELADKKRLQLKWADGRTQELGVFRLRSECPCADCVDEFSGERTLDPATLDPELGLEKVEAVGRYALKLTFSDGHSSGLFTYRMLRELEADEPPAATFEV